MDAGVKEAALAADGEAWRRSQNEQRVVELHAALDHLNERIKLSNPTLFQHFTARADKDVTLIGHSFGGATAATCVLRDSGRSQGARFSHCFLSDPWIGGAASPLAENELAVRPIAAALKTMRVWVNAGSSAVQLFKRAAEQLTSKARSAGVRFVDVIHVPDSGHYAQTDVPTVFENGPLSFLYAAVKGGSQSKGEMPAKEALRSCISETLEPLLEQRWLAVGLAPLPY